MVDAGDLLLGLVALLIALAGVAWVGALFVLFHVLWTDPPTTDPDAKSGPDDPEYS